jgi:Domain of Unknown Function with PDB structure (DUF3857)/Transglutaminase-like superfamily
MKPETAVRFLTLLGVAVVVATAAAAADAPGWMHAAANAQIPSYDAKTNAVLLYSEDVTTVMPDGKMKGIERRVYKILRPEGREYAEVRAYVGRDSRIGSMRGWCIPKSGKDYEVKDKDVVEKTVEGAGELVTDLKVRSLPIPAGDPGNVVGYEIQYDSRPFVLEDYWLFQREIPVKEARYTLQMPSGWEYKAAWLNHSKVEPNPSGGNQWQWVVNDLAAIREENAMPPYRGIAGRMVVSLLGPGARQRSGFLTWEDMGKWQAELANGRRDVTPEIIQKVGVLTSGAATAQQKMQSIAEFMQKDVRYVAIELGIGGFQPHLASEVYSHRYGDCKDKATLMSTMLKQSGIDSYYVVINSRRGAVGPETPPMVFLFNHVILAIKLPDEVQGPRYQAVLNHPKLGRLLIFDPTNEKTPIGQLSGDLQGNYALLVTTEGGELVETPQLPTRSNGITRIGKLKLEAHGTLTGDVQETRFGDFAVYERYAQLSVKSSKDRVKRIEQEVAHSIGMFDITGATMQNLDVNDSPFGYTYTFVAPAYAKQIGDLMAVRPRVMGNRSSNILETKEPRQFPVIFNGPERDTDTFEIALPPGYEPDDLPGPVDVDYGFASYHSKTESVGNVLKYTRTFEIKELSVPLNRMDDLKKFYRIIASDERNTAVLKPVAH